MPDYDSSLNSPLPSGFLRPAEAPGELGRLAHYRVLKELGRGGMGMVFEAEDTQLQRLVALKVIRPDIASREETRARFLREARAAAALKNDHVVTIYQVGEDNGVLFIAMEFLAGRTLEAWLKSGRRPAIAEILVLGKQMARGLAAAHSAGLIHRDIKPANIWLEAPANRAKILDFGLARSMGTDEITDHLTEVGALLGTPSYMSPEQVRGEPLDHRSDLFSFGCVLYRLATGQLPFQGASIAALLSAIATQAPHPVVELNDQVPPRLAELITCLLAKSPADRPATAKGVLDELIAIEKDCKALPPPASPVPQGQTAIVATPSGTPIRRRNRGVFVAVLLVLLLSVAIGFGRGFFVTPDVPPSTNTPPSPAVPEAQRYESKAEHVESKSIDLLKLVDLRRDVQEGRWFWKDDRLRGQDIGKETGGMRLTLPWEPPEEYRLSLRVTRLHKGDVPLAIGLASGDARFGLLVDYPLAPKKGLVSGLSLVNGANLTDRPDARRGRRLPPGQPVVIECVIRSGRITVSADGAEFYDWSGDFSVLDRAPGRTTAPLFVGSGRGGAFDFESITLEPLATDPGRPARSSE